MKKLTLFALLFLSSINFVYTQSGWVQQMYGVANPVTSIFFINENTGWITLSGSNGFVTSGSILRTTNGGLKWVTFMNGSTGFDCIGFINNSTGWVVGNYANDVGVRMRFILKTSNGGINYFIQYQDSLFTPLIKLSVASNNYIFALRQNGQLISSSNSGAIWTSQVLNNSASLVDMMFASEQIGWVLSGFNYILRTTNAGSNWQTIHYAGKIFPKCFHFKDILSGWVIYGPSYKSTTGGVFWNQFTSSGNIVPRDLFFVNSNYGWLCGPNGTIQRTTDSGLNWATQISGGNYSTITLNSIFFVNQQTGWCIGSGTIPPSTSISLILKTTNGGVTGFQQISNETPELFSLSQNYPNPFNPVTNIKFQIPKTSFVKLIVYDILGREVETLVNEQLKPGAYEADWDASDYPSGVYFYRLDVGDPSTSLRVIETKKMVLIK